MTEKERGKGGSVRKREQQGEKKERERKIGRERKVEREGDRRKSSRVQENKNHG